MSQRRTILMAEDNVQFARAKAISLQPAGFDVTVAHDGRVAWKYAQQRQFDVLLTDYDMPGIKGADLCRRLRQDIRYTTTPIILMTCYGRDLDIHRLQSELQLSAVLEKPFQTPELLATLRGSLVGDSFNADLGEIICSVTALEASVESTICRIFCGQCVYVVSGRLQGLHGVVIAQRPARRFLVEVTEGGYIEVAEEHLRALD